MSRSTFFVPLAVAVMLGGCGGGGAPGGSGGSGAGGSGGAAGHQGGSGGATGGIGGGTAGGGGTSSPNAPGAFTLVSPLQGSSAQPLTPTLQWNASDSASSYTVEVATNTSFGTTDVVNQSVSAPMTELMVATPLTAGVIYYWQVTAVNAGGMIVSTGAPQRFSSPYVVAGAHGIAVTPDGTKVVVASDINNGPIDIITLASHAVTASISTGVASQPMGVAVSPDGTQALATLLTNGNGGVNGVAVINLTTNTLTGNISDPCVGTTLGDIVYFPSGTEAAIPDLSGGCTAMGLSTFSPSGTPAFTFINFNDTNDPTGVAISPTGSTAVVTMLLDSKVYKVTFPSTVTPISISSTSAGVAITPDGTKAVVAANNVEVITLSTDSVTSISLTNDSPGGDFHNVAITPDGTEAVVVGSASIQVISLANNTVLSSYPATGGTSVAISVDGKTAFVSDMGDGWVRVLQIP